MDGRFGDAAPRNPGRLSWRLLVGAALVLAVFAPSPAGAVAGYGDVATDRYFTEPVQWSVDNSITGLAGPCFLPDRTVTRGEAARWLWQMQDRPEAPAHNFTDVGVSAAVSWMVHAGITVGTTSTTFSPDDPLNRAQIAAFLWRLENRPEAPAHNFTDAQSPWQQGPVSWMVHAGITVGTTSTTFSPDDPLNRAHLVTFLWRYQDRPAVTINPHTPSTCLPADAASIEGTCPGSTRVVPDRAAFGYSGVWVQYWLHGDLHCTDGPAAIVPHDNGTVQSVWYLQNGAPHRDDGPADISYYEDGTVGREGYYQNGALHRDDGPAWISYFEDGTVEFVWYWQNGEEHRDDGPARISYFEDGTVNSVEYWQNGEEHRDDAPARIGYYDDGTVWFEGYWQNGKRHRDDGPAYIGYFEDGTVKNEEYWRNGERVPPA